MLGVVGTKCLPDCSAAKQLPQSSPRHSHIAKLRSAFMLMSGGSQGLAHLCASTGVQGLFDPISTKKCLEEFSRHKEPERRQISFHPSLWNMHQSSIETDTLQNQRGGLLAWGHSPDLPSQFSPMDHRSFVTLTAARTAADLHCVLFSLRSIQFFPFTGKTGSTH